MPHNRYYLDTIFQEDEKVVIAGDEYHHLSRVLRAGRGDTVELVNGKGLLAQASLLELKKQEAELRIIQVIEESREKTPLVLVQGLTRMNHLEWIIEKGTELDATAFWLFPGILSEKDRLSENQASRLRSIAIAAMKQCGRLDLPSIEEKPPLLKWAPLQGTLLFGDLAKKTPYLWELPLEKPLLSPIFLFIGPESGLDSRESDFLQASLSARPIRLHSNVLRAETAAITALSLIQQYL